MIIKLINIRNFRCLKNVELPCDPVTIFVGPNGTGKSCLLKALQLFFNIDMTYDESDFYNQNTSEDINITITFTNLTPNERGLFNPYLDGEELSIEKIISFPQTRTSQRYYGTKFQNREFDAFRAARGAGLRQEYNRLLAIDAYNEFPPYQNKEIAEQVLTDWELRHRESCQRMRDTGQFFGFRNVGMARLERFTKFILIPAVHEASTEGTEMRGSAISAMMEVVVRSTLANNPELQQLQVMTQQQYNEIVDPDRLPELLGLKDRLTDTLRQFVPDSEVDISWEPGMGVEIELPRAFIKLMEDGYLATVDRAGHGLQRAFILTMFQQLSLIQGSEFETAQEMPERLPMPNLVFAIEEPELYQHPDRQRHFTKTLLRLSQEGIRGSIEQIQIFYSTHSPLMIEPDRMDNIRLFRKIESEANRPKETKISYTSLEEIARDLERACEYPEGSFSGMTLRPRLQAVMTPRMNESYFSKMVVLVEGLKDRAIILGTALALGFELESMGISVIDCNGKSNIDRPLTILKRLGIPYYVIFDSDHNEREPRVRVNHELLRLLDYPVEDFPDVITENFACCETNLEDRLKSEIGEKCYLEIIQKYCDEFELGDTQHAISIPKTIKVLIEDGHKIGAQSFTAETVVNRIISKFNTL